MESDVAIVGAGAAGLAAARDLAERSYRVTVLEGRERIGGRVRWERAGSVAVPVELGAEYIHGDAPETMALMGEAGLPAGPTGESAWRCAADGRLEPDADGIDPGDLFAGARSLERDESVAAFLRRFDGDPARRAQAQLARAFVEGFEAADPQVASARAIAEELGSGVDETSRRPAGGYAPLFAHLAERCARAGAEVRLGRPVERIAWGPGGTTVQGVDAGGAPFAVTARCAIVTVSVGVLQQRAGAAPLAFDPPLPAVTQAAIDGLAMGEVVRVSLAFRTPFWETIAGGRYRDAAFFHCEAGPFGAFWTQLPVRERVVTAWSGGPRAAAMRGLSAAERVERALSAFGTMLGAGDVARAAFEGGVTHDWGADPFACGAYSYVRTGAATARADLGMPAGTTLFFAGEATATDGQGGTVSGAFATGQRAARACVAALEAARR